MGTMFLSFITGGALKIIAGIVSGYVRLRREEKLLLLNADTERMKILYGGDEKSDKFHDWTRRFLAVVITSTLCGVVVFLIMFRPEQEYIIAVPNHTSWLVDFIFGSVDKGTLKLSAGALLWEFVNFVALICGFYFTKILREK